MNNGWLVGIDGTIMHTTNGANTFINEPETVRTPIPSNCSLSQNYPNPFNPLTMIEYQLPQASQVDLCIYNILGQKVVTLVSAKQPAGLYKVRWDAQGFAAGIYFYRLNTDQGFFQTRKLVLLK
jgi:hypothetical protein